jgi:hypothetical protein
MDSSRGESDFSNCPADGGNSLREVDALDLIATIRSVSARGRTGTLDVLGPGGQRRQVYFQDGLIKAVSTPSPEADALEQALLDSGTFSGAEVDEARASAAESGKSLAQVLLERGGALGVDPGELLDKRAREETTRIVRWREPRCRFREGAPPARGSEPYASRLTGGINAAEILDSLGQPTK